MISKKNFEKKRRETIFRVNLLIVTNKRINRTIFGNNFNKVFELFFGTNSKEKNPEKILYTILEKNSTIFAQLLQIFSKIASPLPSVALL